MGSGRGWRAECARNLGRNEPPRVPGGTRLSARRASAVARACLPRLAADSLGPAWPSRLPAAGCARRSAEAGAAWGLAGLKMLSVCGLGGLAAWSGRGAPVRAPGVPRLGLCCRLAGRENVCVSRAQTNWNPSQNI